MVKRYHQLVQMHTNSTELVAAGMKALPDKGQSFAHTQALWRFLHNDEVDLTTLNTPLITQARDAVTQCKSYALNVCDWSHLNYSEHHSKLDRRTANGQKDAGYELQSCLLVNDNNGLPLVSPVQNLVSAEGTWKSYTGKCEATQPHLDELTVRLVWLEKQALGKQLVHIVDREGDSAGHVRQWSASGWQWLVRVRDTSKLDYEGKAQAPAAIAKQLQYTHTADVLCKGKRQEQWVGEAAVVLSRPAKPSRLNDQGKRVGKQFGEALSVRLVVSQIRDNRGNILKQWLLLSNVPTEITSQTIAQWYYWRWNIESYFKLLKSAGLQLEQWQQETGLAILKRCLIVAQSCVVVWQLQGLTGEQAERLQAFLVRLSGRQTKRSKPITAPALLAGLHAFLTMLAVMENYTPAEIKMYTKMVKQLFL